MISDIVFYLLKKGAHREPKRITTGEIAEQLGVSQQTASRKLIELEKNGDLERSGGKVRLTEKSLVEVRRLMREVLDSLKGTGLVFTGRSTWTASGRSWGSYPSREPSTFSSGQTTWKSA
jgi:CTP-dependent riboflavin kinase